MRALLVGAWLSLFALLNSNAHAATLAPIVEPVQWMRALADDFFISGYAQFAKDTQRLEGAVRGMCESPSRLELRRAQEQWRVAARRLRRLEALPIGPTLERRSLRRFDFWPTRPAQIEEAVALRPVSADALKSVGASAQGLPALEYLLFDEKRRLISTPMRCRYAALLAQTVADEATLLDTAWRDWDGQWSGDHVDAAKLKSTLADVVNATVGTLEQLRGRKLEKPAQSRNRREPLFDAWRSGATRVHLISTFDGVRSVIFGGRSGIGLHAVLRGRGHVTLANRIGEEAQAVTVALKALPANLASPSASRGVMRAASAIARLQTTLSREVASVLNVGIGFNESDGD
jgi:predicted lipoprotein